MTAIPVESESLVPREFSRRLLDDDDNKSVYEEEFVSPQKKVPGFLLFAAAAIMFTAGTFDAIASKWMDETSEKACANCGVEQFSAPWYQTWTMYIGEFICMPLYLIDQWYKKKKGAKHGYFEFITSDQSFCKPECPPYLWAIPTFFDMCATAAINYAYLYVAASVSQMMRNFMMAVTAVLTIFYLRIGLRAHQYIGVGIAIGGLIIVGLNAIINPTSHPNNEGMEYVGVVLSLGGTCLTSFQFVLEESLFRRYSCSPVKAVGWQGVWGLVMSSFVMIIGTGVDFEDAGVTLYQVNHNGDLMAASVLYVISIFFFNASGLCVTKLGSGLLRALVSTARTVATWLVEIAIGYAEFSSLQLVGELVLVLGVIMYNYNYIVAGTEFNAKNSIDKFLKHAPFCSANNRLKIKHPDNPYPTGAYSNTPPAKLESQDTTNTPLKRADTPPTVHGESPPTAVPEV